MSSFPPLRLAVLTGLLEIKERVMANPTFFTDEELPYDGETLEVLKKIMEPQVVTKTIEKEVKVSAGRGRPSKDVVLSVEAQEKVHTELSKLLADLDEMGSGEGLPTNERVQITRIKANILEQVLKMQEREVNVKKMSEFMETVVGILDDLVDETGRETFLKRLEPYR